MLWPRLGRCLMISYSPQRCCFALPGAPVPSSSLDNYFGVARAALAQSEAAAMTLGKEASTRVEGARGDGGDVKLFNHTSSWPFTTAADAVARSHDAFFLWRLRFAEMTRRRRWRSERDDI